MKVGSFPKQPAEKLVVSVVYADALEPDDGISSVESCEVFPAGELSASPVLLSTDRVRVWVDGGVDGSSYKITVIVKTANGERLEDELICKVKEI